MDSDGDDDGEDDPEVLDKIVQCGQNTGKYSIYSNHIDQSYYWYNSLVGYML